jgi:hypothetical protein
MIYLDLFKEFWRELLIAILGTTLVILVLSHKNTVLKLNNAITIEKSNNRKLDDSVNDLQEALDKQTLATMAISVDYNNSIVELNKWKAKPAEIKYITIPTLIREIKSNDCNDTKNAINSIRTIDYGLL